MATSETCIGVVLNDSLVLTLGDLCRACDVHADWLMELIDEGVLEPHGPDPAQWRFAGVSLRRVRIIRHLQRDLGVNLAGAALALQLMEERDMLRERLRGVFGERLA